MKKTMTLLVCLVMAMSISARSYESEVVDTMAQKEFTLNTEKVKLRVSETFQLEIIWDDPEWAAANSKGVHYYCNSDVASVNKEGLITARRAGEAYVNVSANGVSHVCNVVVEEGNPDVVQHRGRMTLPLGEFLDGEGNDLKVTFTDGTMRLTGSFWGHACIPSELEYEILDGSAFFNIYTNSEDSTCTDGWQGSFMVRQTIDVSFEGCTSDIYRVYINNMLQGVYDKYPELLNATVVYRTAPNRYGTDICVDLNRTAESEGLAAMVGEDSIRISGYYLSNCASPLYCLTHTEGSSIALTIYELWPMANCVENHYVTFTIPRTIEKIEKIYVCDEYDQSERMQVKIQGTGTINNIKPETDAPYYDLMGRKVSNPTRGIYIRNGQKVIR